MSNKNTVVRAIRIDSSLDKSIAEIAEQKGLSFNLLVNQILAKYSEYDRVSEKLGLIDVPPSTIKNMLSLITNEESEKLGELSGFAGRNAKQFVTMLMGNSSLDSFIATIKLLEKYSGAFSAEISSRQDGECQVIMSHNLGAKWSYFLKGMMAATLREIYELDARFEATETFLTTSFSIPRKMVAATSVPQ